MKCNCSCYFVCKIHIFFNILMKIRRAVIVYAILNWTLFVSGLYIASFGVLIPYYSRASGKDET